jgi:hypothetical protein
MWNGSFQRLEIASINKYKKMVAVAKPYFAVFSIVKGLLSAREERIANDEHQSFGLSG